MVSSSFSNFTGYGGGNAKAKVKSRFIQLNHALILFNRDLLPLYSNIVFSIKGLNIGNMANFFANIGYIGKMKKKFGICRFQYTRQF